jgi:hypothetical protein
LKIFTAPPFKDLVHQTLQDTAVAFYDGFKRFIYGVDIHGYGKKRTQDNEV